MKKERNPYLLLDAGTFPSRGERIHYTVKELEKHPNNPDPANFIGAVKYREPGGSWRALPFACAVNPYLELERIASLMLENDRL